MSASYDLSTDVGKIRLIIPDMLEDSIFSDAEIETFLSIEGGNLRRGAALALETLATDEARVQKVQKLPDFETDGKALLEALLARAKRLRDEASRLDAKADQEEELSSMPFAVAERVLNSFSARERVFNEALRNQ